MPHATHPPLPSLQALILCGPGLSLNTFTSNPAQSPKCLLPIANRPMLWYPLISCHRMGITSIHLIIPPDAKEALETALATHPALTSLPGPKPEVLAPEGLEQTSGTAELLRLPEVQGVVTRDFVVLPCDLVSELDGSKVLQQWLTLNPSSTSNSSNSKQSKRGGGMALYYPTHGREGISSESKKVVDETDFLATVPISLPAVPPPAGSLRNNVEEVVLTMPTDTLNDTLEENNGSLPIRQRLLNKHSNVKMRTRHRDAHVYFFPHWVKDFIAHPNNSEKFESLSEDVLGAWAQAGWRPSLASKLGLDEVLGGKRGAEENGGEAVGTHAAFDDTGDGGSMTPARFSELELQEGEEEEEVDVMALSSTKVSVPLHVKQEREGKWFASRVQVPATTETEPQTKTKSASKPVSKPKSHVHIPPLLAYIQPPLPSLPLIRRVDTAPQLASISLYLAKLPATSSAEPGVVYNALALEYKVHPTATIGPQSRVSEGDSLVAENVTIGSRTNIKESVIGANCEIGGMVKLTRCVLMEGVVVGDGVTMTGCIIGKRARIEGMASAPTSVDGGSGKAGDGVGDGAKGKGKGKKRAEDEEERTKLTDCEVAPFFVVEAGTESKGETLKGFDEEGSLDEEDGEDGEGEEGEGLDDGDGEEIDV
ncbi:Translation initiation factor eIF-2B subunit gamma [Elasticomyces elasticus]|nr:Translation initiation factor eIF-2B subunit gamma [Elasticomyces elasticus]KAK3643025.1 Translation initiation factor eIF-2B subunit gamma [Elasticomyces elasticus]KAK4916818.1 Translation initiation factor eIF-2B subunit gamma [Elasticomyces elasticus]